MLNFFLIDVIGPVNVLFTGESMHHSLSPEILQAGSVKGLLLLGDSAKLVC